jgi:hypothetical protein
MHRLLAFGLFGLAAITIPAACAKGEELDDGAFTVVTVTPGTGGTTGMTVGPTTGSGGVPVTTGGPTTGPTTGVTSTTATTGVTVSTTSGGGFGGSPGTGGASTTGSGGRPATTSTTATTTSSTTGGGGMGGSGGSCTPTISDYSAGKCNATVLYQGKVYKCISQYMGVNGEPTGCGETGVYCNQIKPDDSVFGMRAWQAVSGCP